MKKWKKLPAKPPSPPPVDPDATTISGTVERVVFHSEESGYTVCGVMVPGVPTEMTVVGSCAAVWVGENLKATGRWTRHPQHGNQFQADQIVCVPPVDTAGIEKYLGSGMIKGIGPVMAKRLVRRFGSDTIRVLDKESARLLEVPGIGSTRREQIRTSWQEQRAVRDIMIFLQSHGSGVAQAHRIYRQYRENAIAIVMSNPYRLCRDIWGIGFRTADKVAQSVGVPTESPMRARAGVIYALQTAGDEGDCFLPRPELIETAASLLGIRAEILDQAVTDEVAAGTLVDDAGRVYLSAMHEAETGVASMLARLWAQPPGFAPITVDKALPWAEQRMGLRFAPAQADALRMALREKVSIITGGPGVGKTTIVRALVDVFQARRLTVCLAAPTGRAAKRLAEATAHESRTVHRLLKYNPAKGVFEHDRGNPVEGQVFILDEVSMMDVALMHTLLRALPDRAWLVLVGDVDQLPSVGPGNVLRDLIESSAVPFTRLNTIFRQESNSWIVLNAHRVNEGQGLELPPKDQPADFYFVEQEDPEEVIKALLALVTRRIPQRFGFDPRTEVQVLTPMRRNQLGSENLNTVLQDALNPSGPCVERYGRRFRLGDRVLQVRNNYDKNVFNGDIGIIRAIDEKTLELIVEFDGGRVAYSTMEIDELELAYACSIHKSQGSEYPAVIVLLATQHFRLLQRNLLYTAITRGRKLVCLVGSRRAVWIAIRNDQIRLRRTALRERVARALLGDALRREPLAPS